MITVRLHQRHMEFDDKATLHPCLYDWLIEHVGFGHEEPYDRISVSYLVSSDDYPNVWGWSPNFVTNTGIFQFKDPRSATLFKLTWV